MKAQLGNRTIFRSWNLASHIVKNIGIPFNCDKCIHCRKNNSLELARRCVLNASLYQDNCFITLTYDESSLGDNTINYSHVQKFKKRLRKHCKGKKIEIFNVHEYGKNGRKHWHLVIFNHDFADKTLYSTNSGIPIYTSEKLRKLWPFGYNTIGNVTEASALYQAQYTQKDIINGNTNNAQKAKSNHSGIGRSYFLRHYKQFLSLGYIPFDGNKMPLPRYFEKLADRHYCHYYDQSAFFETADRKKAKHRPFKAGEENKEIADLFANYKLIKAENLKEQIQQWKETLNALNKNLQKPNYKPDFVKSGENTLSEMKNKKQLTQEKF